MDPRSEVLLRQRHLFATPLLLAGLPADDLLAELPQAQGWSWHAGEQAQLDARFPGRSRFDTRAPTGAWTSAVLFLPKSRELTDYLLASLAARLPGGELFWSAKSAAGSSARASSWPPTASPANWIARGIASSGRCVSNRRRPSPTCTPWPSATACRWPMASCRW